MAEKKKGNIGNEEILRYLWNALNYPQNLGIDGESFLRDETYADAKKASTFNEFANHVANRMAKDPSYLNDALEAMQADTDTEIPATAWNQSVAKQRDLNLDNMSRADVDALTQALALQLGFSDSGENNGALSGLLAATQNNEGDLNFKDLVFERLNDNEKRDAFLSALDFSPNAGDKDIYEALSKMWNRSMKAYKYDRDTNGATKLLKTLAFPQSSKKESEGLDPNRNDMATDLGTLAVLAATGNPIIAAGVGVGGDIVHDAVDAEGKRKEYEYGQNERIEDGDWKEGITEENLANAALAALLSAGGVGGRFGAGKLKNSRILGPVIDKAEKGLEKGVDKVMKLFGKKQTPAQKAAATRAKNKATDARKEAYAAEEDYKRFAPDKGAVGEQYGQELEEAASRRLNMEQKQAALAEAERKAAELAQTPSSKVLETIAKGARYGKNAAKGRLYDPNFYAVDLLGNGMGWILGKRKEQ